MRGNQFESLTVLIIDETEIRNSLTRYCIAEHCTNLTHLNLLNSRSRVLPLFCQQVRAKLTILRFKSLLMSASNIIEIQTHCRQLIDIDVGWFSAYIVTEVAFAITELLKSYGEKL